MITPDINDWWEKAKRSADICEHMETLLRYAMMVDSVVEFGVRAGASSTAWMKAKVKRVRCYDVDQCDIAFFREHAAANGMDYDFIRADDLTVEIDPVDLLFIDTHHTYPQLTAEMDMHGDKVRKYIICHDTTYAPECYTAITDYINRNPQWRIKEHYANNNGLTILERHED